MPDTTTLTEIKISELPVASSLSSTDQIEINQAGISRSGTIAQVAAAVPPPDLTDYVTDEELADAIATIPPTNWASIPGKPATFPPTLPIPESGVTNLVSDLAGKAPVSHSHTAGDLPPYPTTLPPSGAAGGALAGSYPNPTLVGGPLSNYALSSSIPTTLPPNGTAGGDLAGSYPNPTIKPSVTNGQVLTTVAGVAAWAAAAGGGSVTSTSVVSANGLAGTVATPTTTPAITLSTTITGLLKGNGTAISAAVAGTDYVTPATNTVLQTAAFETGAMATGTTLIPIDDTIPQITEGNEYMTLAITPQIATSRLIIEVTAILANSAASRLVAALFQNSTANALAVADSSGTAVNAPVTISFKHTMTSGTTSATTFRVRCGTSIAGTTTFNGSGGSRLYGGAYASSIVITEVSS